MYYIIYILPIQRIARFHDMLGKEDIQQEPGIHFSYVVWVMTRAWVQLTMLWIILQNMNCPQHTSWGFAEKSVLDCELWLCRCGSRCFLAVAGWDFQSRRQNLWRQLHWTLCWHACKEQNSKVFLTQCLSQWYATLLYNEISYLRTT